MGGLVCAVHRRKNKGFPTLKRTLNLGIEKGRLLKNSRPKGGLIQVICYPASPETVDITGFFEKFCIAIRTISKRAYLRITNVDTLFFMFFNVLTCSNTLFSRRKKQPGCNPQPGLYYIVLSLINFSSAAPAVSSWRSRICVYTRRVVVMSECPLCRGTAVEHLLHDFLKRLDDRT